MTYLPSARQHNDSSFSTIHYYTIFIYLIVNYCIIIMFMCKRSCYIVLIVATTSSSLFAIHQ